MKCTKCLIKDAVSPFHDCDDCYEDRKREGRSAYYKSVIEEQLKITKCVKCAKEKNGSYPFCFPCFQIWDRNGRSFPDEIVSQKCLIVDSDDEEEEQPAPEPIVAPELKVLCKYCKIKPPSAPCFVDCEDCYNQKKHEGLKEFWEQERKKKEYYANKKDCVDCSKPVYGTYVRCFDCNKKKQEIPRTCMFRDD
jgi:hypothetical protein